MNKSTLQFCVAALLAGGAESAVTLTSMNAISETSFVTGPTAILQDEGSAIQVTTDAGSWQFDSLEVSWEIPFGFGSSPVEVSICTTGDPFSGGPAVKHVSNGNPNPSSAVETYQPTSTLTFSPGQSFWVLLEVPVGGGDYVVQSANVLNSTGPWIYANQQVKVAGRCFGTGNVPAMRFNATAVPEPSVAALFGVLFLPRLRRSRWQGVRAA